jgi:hypothetical protein
MRCRKMALQGYLPRWSHGPTARGGLGPSSGGRDCLKRATGILPKGGDRQTRRSRTTAERETLKRRQLPSTDHSFVQGWPSPGSVPIFGSSGFRCERPIFPGAVAKTSAVSEAESRGRKKQAGHKPTSDSWPAWCSVLAAPFGDATRRGRAFFFACPPLSGHAGPSG